MEKKNNFHLKLDKRTKEKPTMSKEFSSFGMEK
jgi:hypothetical protein